MATIPALETFGSVGQASMIWAKSGWFSRSSGKQAGKTRDAEIEMRSTATPCDDCRLGFKPSVAAEKSPGGFDSLPLPL